MKLLFSAFLSFLVIHATAQTPKYSWSRALSGPVDQTAKDIAIDRRGNTITVGAFTGLTDFDPGPGNFPAVAIHPFYVYVSKIDSLGNFVWAKTFGLPNSNIEVNACTTDSANRIFIVGRFSGIIDFDPGPGFYGANGNDGFVVKLDSMGNFQWLTTFAFCYIRDIAIDQNGAVYVTGDQTDDVMVSKLNTNGAILWNYVVGNPLSNDWGLSIAVSSAGNVFVTGTYQGTTDFDAGVGNNTLYCAGSTDAFVLKLSTTGTHIWAKQVSGPNQDWGQGIAIDKNENCFVAGTFQSATDFDPSAAVYWKNSSGFRDAYVLHLNAQGNFVWVKTFGGTSADTDGYDICIDKDNRILMCGAFFGEVNRFGNKAIVPLHTPLYTDAYILSFDASGNFLWAKQFGGALHDFALGVAVTDSLDIYLTGSFQLTTDFNINQGVDTIVSQGYFDAYVLKMRTCVPSQVPNISSTKNPLCSGEQSTLTATGGTNFVWNTGANSSTIAVLPQYKSFYYAEGVSMNGCSIEASFTQSVVACLGIESYSDQPKIRVFPNPNNGIMQVKGAEDFQTLSCSVVDVYSRVLWQGIFAEQCIQEIDLRPLQLADGIYYLKYKANGIEGSTKIQIKNK